MKKCLIHWSMKLRKFPGSLLIKLISIFFQKKKNIFMWIWKLWIIRRIRVFCRVCLKRLKFEHFCSLLWSGGGGCACYEKTPQYFVAWFYCMFNPLLYSSLYTYPIPTLFPTHSYINWTKTSTNPQKASPSFPHVNFSNPPFFIYIFRVRVFQR